MADNLTTGKRRILITGASGTLGKQLLYCLTQAGERPIAHVRDSSDTTYIDSLGLEKRVADLRNQDQLARLVEGIDVIIHTVAWVNFRQDRMTQFTGINVFGAVNLYQAAHRAGVRRFVHVSSIGAVGGRPRTGANQPLLIDETHEFNLEHLKIPYLLTKHAAEKELLSLARVGPTELVILCPSIMVAPSRTGDDRTKAARRVRFPILPRLDNWMNLVDIRDVVPAIIAAIERGRPGERYILAGDNITACELLLLVCGLLDRKPQLVRIPRSIINVAARLAVAFDRLRGKGKISFYPDLVRLADYDWAFSSQKARAELGFSPRPLQTTLQDLLTNNFVGTYLKPEP